MARKVPIAWRSWGEVAAPQCRQHPLVDRPGRGPRPVFPAGEDVGTGQVRHRLADLILVRIFAHDGLPGDCPYKVQRQFLSEFLGTIFKQAM